MKTTFKAVLFYLVMAAMVFTGCPTEPGDDGTGNGGGGILTISGLPAGTSGAVYVCDPEGAIGTQAALTNAVSTSLIATGTIAGSSVSLTGKSGGAFTDSGTFLVVLETSSAAAAAAGTTVATLYATAVSFTNGSANVSYNSLDNKSELPAGSNSGGGDPDTPTVVTARNLTPYVIAPVAGGTPGTSLTGTNSQYTGTIAWTTGSDTPVSGKFAVSTVYTATVTLTAKSGYTFTGLTANSFTYTGATSVVTSNISATGATVTIVFPVPATVVSDLDLTGYVTAPAAGGTPATDLAGSPTQYTGAIAWKAGTADVGSTFEANKVYTATVTLTAESGCSFTGLTGSFTRTGATAITTTVTSATSATVTIVFPSTGPKTVVSEGLDLTGAITKPVRYETPIGTFSGSPDQYTAGTVSWKDSDDMDVSGKFAAETAYKATVTLTAKDNYTFTGFTAGFTYTDATIAITNNATSVTVTITFPATDPDTQVNSLNLTSLITKPERGNQADTSFAGNDQYTGTITWKTATDVAHTGIFTPSTVYKAIVSLTGKEGYTFTGLTETSFTYSDTTTVTTTVTSAAGATVTIAFPKTGDPAPSDMGIGNPTVKLYLNSGTQALTDGGTSPIDKGTGSFTVGIDSGTYGKVTWYLNGTELTAKNGALILDIHKVVGTYQVRVEATKDGVMQSGSHTFQVK